MFFRPIFGFSAALFLVSLYFYTSTFPAIVSFLRTPLFWLGKVALLIRLLDKLVVYREVKRLDSSIMARGYLLAGGPLVLFSNKTGFYGAQIFLTTPTQFGAISKAERLMRIDTIDELFRTLPSDVRASDKIRKHRQVVFYEPIKRFKRYAVI